MGSLVAGDIVDFAVGIMAALEAEPELEVEFAALVGLGVVAAQLAEQLVVWLFVWGVN